MSQFMFMKRSEEVELRYLPPGLFFFGDTIGFKNEYHEAFIVETGEAFWGGTHKKEDRDRLKVIELRLIRI